MTVVASTSSPGISWNETSTRRSVPRLASRTRASPVVDLRLLGEHERVECLSRIGEVLAEVGVADQPDGGRGRAREQRASRAGRPPGRSRPPGARPAAPGPRSRRATTSLRRRRRTASTVGSPRRSRRRRAAVSRTPARIRTCRVGHQRTAMPEGMLRTGTVPPVAPRGPGGQRSDPASRPPVGGTITAPDQAPNRALGRLDAWLADTPQAHGRTIGARAHDHPRVAHPRTGPEDCATASTPGEPARRRMAVDSHTRRQQRTWMLTGSLSRVAGRTP